MTQPASGADSLAPAPETPWNTGALVGFDLETTGTDPFTARIVTGSLVVVDPSGVPRSASEWLVNPGVEIPEEAAKVHGISTEYAQTHGQPPAQGVSELANTLRDFMAAGIPIVVYNGSYDFTVLSTEVSRHGLDPLEVTGVVDAYILDKQLDKYRKGKRTLEMVTTHYGVELDNAHASAADALAAVHVAQKIAEKFPEVQATLSSLFAQQKTWKAEQAADFESYLRRTKDPHATISRDWPVERPRSS